MIINHNLNSMNAHRNMSFNTTQTGKAMEKLSSGLRINRAGDDAAGLAISEKMRGQIRGLDQASRNSQDGISLIQTAEGALNESHAILQRMRELSVQSATDTNTTADRSEIQKEMDQLGKEIDRISSTTQFNTKNLLDGSMGKGITAAEANVNTNNALGTTLATTSLTNLTDSNGNNLGISIGDTVSVSYVENGVTKEASITVADAVTGPPAVPATNMGNLVSLVAGASATYGATGGMSLEAGAAGFNNAINGLTITVKDSNNVVKAGATNALSSFSETTAASDVRADGQATFQIGANTGQNIQLSIENMSSAALGVKDLKVGTQGQANVAIKVLDGALAKVSSERSKLGSVQNRLEHTINNLNVGAENLQAAESRIRDVDMAKEMMNFTKNNILNQAAQAMMAQSKSQPEAVLQLLR